MIINLISSPRNLSTAIMYSFAHRGDFKVVDEPFYAYYLNKTNADHPGKEETLQSQSTDIEIVIDEISRLEKKHGCVFLKNMAHHMIDMDLEFIKSWTNVFLIRNPKQLIASFAQVISEPSHTDIGVKRQYEIFQFLGEKGIVLNSGDLLQNPDGVLTQLCGKLKIPMSQSMLEWTPGPIAEDGVWAKYWYKNVHLSAGFSSQSTSERKLPTHLNPLYKEALPYYKELSKIAIKA